jgi:lysophospholipase L1-like esterase
VLQPPHSLITANYGGRSAKWGFENLEMSVLEYQPDLVTIWWGFNDLLGCSGFFDRETDAFYPYQLTWLIDQHIQYLRRQIDALLEKQVAVVVITAIPISGELPWTHFDKDYHLVWELSHRCPYNTGLKQPAEAQRMLVLEYSENWQNVSLVDAWQIYQDNRTTGWMYIDIMHPGPKGAELIADGWLEVFHEKQATLQSGRE